ncbi:hypothetical protein CSHISOI_09467, partial [Colletotrichum shisoi]
LRVRLNLPRRVAQTRLTWSCITLLGQSVVWPVVSIRSAISTCLHHDCLCDIECPVYDFIHSPSNECVCARPECAMPVRSSIVNSRRASSPRLRRLGRIPIGVMV